jgi:hypothetical protein
MCRISNGMLDRRNCGVLRQLGKESPSQPSRQMVRSSGYNRCHCVIANKRTARFFANLYTP